MFIVNIHSKGKGAAAVLSNFYPRSFRLDGVEIGSLEGFLQSLKIKDAEEQKKVCLLCGKEAKLRGSEYKWERFLYWRGMAVDRYSDEYRELLLRAYRKALSQNSDFREALMSTRGKLLIHTIGKMRKKDTVLTSLEFCTILMKLRKEIIKNTYIKEKEK